MDNRTMRITLIAVFVLAVVLFIAGGGLLLAGLAAEQQVEQQAELAATDAPTQSLETLVAQTVAAIVQASATAQAIASPQIVAQAQATPDVPPTATAVPTVPATDTPIPTETPVPTDVPTAVPPTNTPVPFVPTHTPTATAVPPTNTPAPPPGPQPGNHNGLIATHFALQDWRTNPVVNGEIWYEWTIANTSGGGVAYSTIGIMPRKDGVDRVQWYQNNWGGNNDVMPPAGLSWPSWMALPEAGNYTLRVVVCFDGFQTCRNGQGTFHTLSNEIPITIH